MTFLVKRWAAVLRFLPISTAGFAAVTVVKAGAGLLIVKVISAGFGPEAFGQLAQLMTVVAIVSMLAGGGTTNALIQSLVSAVSEQDRQRRLTAAFKIYLAQSIIVSVALIAGNALFARFLLQDNTLSWLFLLLAATQWVVGANNLSQAMLTAMQRSRVIILSNMIGTCVGAFVFIACVWPGNYAGAALGIVLYPVVGAVIGLWFAAKTIPLSWRRPVWATTRDDITNLLSYSGVVVISLAAVPLAQIYVRDIVGGRFGWEVVGYWQTVLKISDVYMQFFGMLMIYQALPYYSAATSLADLDKRWRHVMYPILGLMVGGLCLFYVLREFVLRVLFSEAFLPAQQFVLPCIVGDFFRIAGVFFVFYGISQGARLMPILFDLTQAILLIAVAILLLPVYEGMAPAYATLFAGLGGFIVMVAMRAVRRSHWKAKLEGVA